MATISELTFAERVILPFCTLIPISVAILGYWVWKRDKLNEDERMTERLSYMFSANCAGMLGLAIYHVLRHVMFVVDYRIGMTAFGVSFLVFTTLAMQFGVMQLDADSEILLGDDNEVKDYLETDLDGLQQLGPEQGRVGRNVPRRTYIAVMTYLVIVLQSGFDGLVLKYNPNAQSSALQVGIPSVPLPVSVLSPDCTPTGRHVLPDQGGGERGGVHGPDPCGNPGALLCHVHVQLHRDRGPEHTVCL